MYINTIGINILRCWRPSHSPHNPSQNETHWIVTGLHKTILESWRISETPHPKPSQPPTLARALSPSHSAPLATMGRSTAQRCECDEGLEAEAAYVAWPNKAEASKFLGGFDGSMMDLRWISVWSRLRFACTFSVTQGSCLFNWFQVRSDFPRFAGPQLGRGASGRGWLVEHPKARHSLIPKTTNSNSTPLENEIIFV